MPNTIDSDTILPNEPPEDNEIVAINNNDTVLPPAGSDVAEVHEKKGFLGSLAIIKRIFIRDKSTHDDWDSDFPH